MSDTPAWERRFRAPILSFPAWADQDPDRLVVASSESGSYQLHAWDRPIGRRRQVTFDPVGVLEGRPTRDGSGVVWFRDETGDETGTFVVAPFDEDRRITADTACRRAGRITDRRRRSRPSLQRFSCRTGRATRAATPRPPVWLRPVGMSGPLTGRASADDAVVVLEVMDDGDVLHPSLRSVDAVTGRTSRSSGTRASGWPALASPVGRLRMAITHERIGERRPALWRAHGRAHGSGRPARLRGARRSGGRTALRFCSSVLQAGAPALPHEVATAGTRLETGPGPSRPPRCAGRQRLVPRDTTACIRPAARGRFGRAAPRAGLPHRRTAFGLVVRGRPARPRFLVTGGRARTR
jgi:hypothetical protein